MERKEVVAALQRNNWVQSQAAKELGLTLRQIGYRIKKFGLEAMVEKRRTQGVDFRARSWN
jgi:Nif-specific regulatory protein